MIVVENNIFFGLLIYCKIYLKKNVCNNYKWIEYLIEEIFFRDFTLPPIQNS